MAVVSERETGRIWENYRTLRGNLHCQNAGISHRNGTGCPVRGCTWCDVSDCFYAEFIRSCLGCAKGDCYLYRKAGWIGKTSQLGPSSDKRGKQNKIHKAISMV